jgi:2-haloacid dehalogenase
VQRKHHLGHFEESTARRLLGTHVATYTKAAEIVGVALHEVLFVANHAFDCIGAKAAGMRAAFIDRRQRPFGVTPYQPD